MVIGAASAATARPESDAGARQVPHQPPAPTPGQQTSKPAEAGAPFTYNPEGRRDPFVSLSDAATIRRRRARDRRACPGSSLMK